MAVTEICTVTLNKDTDIKDQNTAGAKTLNECFDLIVRQHGVRGLWFGTEEEDPPALQLFINWESKFHHEKFMAADVYKTLTERLDSISASALNVVHVDFQPDEAGVQAALSAPVTQVATFYYDEAPPASSFEGAKTLVEALQNDGTKVLGWAYGPTHEVLSKDGGKGKANMFLVGWESVEAHFASHETQVLKDNFHKLVTAEVKTYGQHHVKALMYRSS